MSDRKFLHTLAQPVTALHCTAELKLRSNPACPQCRDSLQQTLKITDTLMQIISRQRQLLEATDPGQKEVADLAAIAKSACELHQGLLRESGRTLFLETHSPAVVYGDPWRLEQLLLLLLDRNLETYRGQDELLLFITTVASQVILYFGPTFSPFGLPPGEITAFAVNGSEQLLMNYCNTAGGSLDILRTSDAVRFLIRFPQYSAPDVSAETPLEFNI